MTDVLETVIKQTLELLPSWCKDDDVTSHCGYHEWITAYGDANLDDIHRSRRVTKMLPSYVCKHCHAVGTIKAGDLYNNDPVITRDR